MKTVMSEPGKAMAGTAVAGGPDRANKAADMAVASRCWKASASGAQADPAGVVCWC